MRIEADMLHKLQFIADANRCSVNRELNRIIYKHIQAFEKENGLIECEEKKSG